MTSSPLSNETGSLVMTSSPLSDESDLNDTKNDENGIWYALIIIGCGFLLPWDAIITSVDYLTLKFPNEHVEYRVAAAYMIMNMATMASTVYGLTRWRQCSILMPIYTRLMIGFITLFILMLVISFIDDLALFITLCALCGMADGFTQINVYGLTAMLPTQYSGAVMAGNGSAGLVAVVLRVISKLAFPHTSRGLRHSTRLYYFVCGLVVVICLYCVVYIRRSPYVRRFHRAATVTNTIEEVELIQQQQQQQSTTATTTQSSSSSPSLVGFERTKAVAYEVRYFGLAVCVNFTITLSMFPGLTGELTSTMMGIGDWFNVCLMAVFMVFDYIGRARPTFARCRVPPIRLHTWTGPRLLRFAVARVLFIPLMLLSYYAQHNKWHGVAGGWFGADVYTLLLMAVFAVSNGYVSTLCMMLGGGAVSDPTNSELAGNIMAFCLVAGLTLGATTGMIISLVAL